MPRLHGRRAALYVQISQSLLKQLRTYCQEEGLFVSRVVESSIAAHLAVRSEGGAGLLSDGTKRKLRALQDALWGASGERIIEAALDRFIAEQVAENPTFQQRFEAAEQRLLETHGSRETGERVTRFLPHAPEESA